MTIKAPSLFDKAVLWYSGLEVKNQNPKTITAAGDAKQIKSPVNGCGVGVFDGTDDYLSINMSTGFTLFNSDFTYETWISFKSIASNVALGMYYLSSTSYMSWYWASSENRIYIGINVSGTSVTQFYCSFTPTINTHYHIVIERIGSSCLMFINGIQQSVTQVTSWSSLTDTSGEIRIGRGISVYSNIYLSSYRISDVARYTSNFTPSREKFIPDANTKLLIHFDQTSTSFTDSSPTPKTITPNGGVYQIISPVAGSGMAYFDGTGDYLSIPYSDDWYFGTSSFTIEFLIYLSDVTTTQSIFAQGTDGNNIHRCYVWNGNIIWNTWNSGVSGWDISNAISINTWYHVALVRSGSTQKVYLNGILASNSGASSASIGNYSGTLNIAAYKYGSDYYLNGYLSEFRISKDVSRYSGSTITVPTTQFIPDIYTKLLLHFANTNAPTVFSDAAEPYLNVGCPILPSGVTETYNGTFNRLDLGNNRVVRTFDGSTNYVSLTDNDAWNIYNGSMTIATWWKPNAQTVSHVFANQRSSLYPHNFWGFYVHLTTGVSTTLYLQRYISGTEDGTWYKAYTFTTGQWYHVAVAKSGTSTPTFYINGVALTDITTVSAQSSTSHNVPYPLTVGYETFITTPERYMNGLLKDMVIYKDRAMSAAEIKQLMILTDPMNGEGLLPGLTSAGQIYNYIKVTA